MTKVVSDAQLAANRLNAAKSTGPNTAAGKARASRNALKHGLLAKAVFGGAPLPGEHRDQFDALLADLLAQLKPKGVIEEALVDRIATCYWRLARAQRIENSVIADSTESAPTAPANLDKRCNDLDTAQRDLQTERRLVELLEKPQQDRAPAEAAELQHSLTDFAKAYALARLDLPPEALQERVQDMLPGVIARLERRVQVLRADLQAAQLEDSLRASRESRAACLPQGNEFLKILRYETMLDRQVHRALAEFRKLRALHTKRRTKKKRLRNIEEG